MKREGKQHGMVRTYRILPNPKPGTRFITQFDSPPAAGVFTKVPSKPTNHSKFTGKCCKVRCTDCRLHPVSKSKSKAKGSFKHFQVMDQPGLKFIGLSATGTLNHISNWYVDDNDEEEEDESVVDHMDDVEDESVVDHVPDDDDGDDVKDESVVEHEDDVKNESVVEHEDDDDDEVEDANNSCTLDEKEVEHPLRVKQVNEEKYEEEDWCLVEVECCT